VKKNILCFVTFSPGESKWVSGGIAIALFALKADIMSVMVPCFAEVIGAAAGTASSESIVRSVLSADFLDLKGGMIEICRYGIPLAWIG
jgi:hypothetical protein